MSLRSAVMNRRTMSSAVNTVGAAIAVLIAQVPIASPSSAVTMAEVHSWCAGYPDTEKRGLCEGYIKTIAEAVSKDDPVYNMGRRACVPPEEPVANLVKLFLDYTEKNPQTRSQELGPTFGTALQRQYPCR